MAFVAIALLARYTNINGGGAGVRPHSGPPDSFRETGHAQRRGGLLMRVFVRSCILALLLALCGLTAAQAASAPEVKRTHKGSPRHNSKLKRFSQVVLDLVERYYVKDA